MRPRCRGATRPSFASVLRHRRNEGAGDLNRGAGDPLRRGRGGDLKRALARPSKKRARGMPGARGTRSPCAAKNAHGSHHRYSGTPGICLRNGFTAYALLSPATNSSCHRRRRISGASKSGWARNTSANLTPATGARTTRFCRTRPAFRQEASAGMCTSGRALVEDGKQRRSFTREYIAHRPCGRPCACLARRRCRVHRIPHPTFRDDHDTPLEGTGQPGIGR